MHTSGPTRALLRVTRHQASLRRLARFSLTHRVAQHHSRRQRSSHRLIMAKNGRDRALKRLRSIPRIIPSRARAITRATILIKFTIMRNSTFNILTGPRRKRTRINFGTLLLVIRASRAAASRIYRPATSRHVRRRAPRRMTKGNSTRRFGTTQGTPRGSQRQRRTSSITRRASTRFRNTKNRHVRIFKGPLIKIVNMATLLRLMMVLIPRPANRVLFNGPNAPTGNRRLHRMRTVRHTRGHRYHGTTRVRSRLPRHNLVLFLRNIMRVLMPAISPRQGHRTRRQRRGRHSRRHPHLTLLFATPMQHSRHPSFTGGLPTRDVVSHTVFDILLRRLNSVKGDAHAHQS